MTDNSDIYKRALEYHARQPAGKLGMSPTKPMNTQDDLALAYSPGVAGVCEAIAKNPDDVYKYTAKRNTVAVISNGTAVLGLGNLGPAPSKPVMEGKAVLFKRFADIDAIDVEVKTTDIEEFITVVKNIGDTWGGINLEDIASPECFIIEKRLQEELKVPVFHDDQHGTAIIVAAALINALDITHRNIQQIKVVVNGAGAAGIACIELIKALGVPHNSVIVCDQYGVVYSGRENNMNPWKLKHAVDTSERTLKEALQDADVFVGLSVKGALAPEMLMGMNKDPIVFAMANPDPEIVPEVAHAARPDVIMATGRSDYPNQVNNVMGFPYIFRGALDVRASAINEAMKMAAARAIASLAREPVHDDVFVAYARSDMQYSKNYIIPVPFDPRLISTVAPAVAKAAIDSGVSRIEIPNWITYQHALNSSFNPTLNVFGMLYESLRKSPKRVVFAEGEEEKIIKVAVTLRDGGYIHPILVGDAKKIEARMDAIGISNRDGIAIANAAISDKNEEYIEYMYAKNQRFGRLKRDCAREVKTDRNTFASCLLASGGADAMITGLTRGYIDSLRAVRQIIRSTGVLFGFSMVVARERTIFIADTSVNLEMTSEAMAEIAVSLSDKVRKLGQQPRVAFISYSNFGNPRDKASRNKIRGAVEILNSRKVDFEYDGEMAVDTALNKNMLGLYPFCKLTDAANILIMPNVHSANISYKILKEISGTTVFGPLLVGAEKSVQIINLNASISDIQNLVVWAAVDS